MKKTPEFTSPIYITKEKPKGFSPQAEVGLCFIIVNEKTLLLKTADHKKARGYWTAPAGIIEHGETIYPRHSKRGVRRNWNYSQRDRSNF